MFRYLLTGGGSPKEYAIHLLLCLPIILLSLSMHETAHGYVAYKLGDHTARNLGRLTLNPAKHLDPMGFLCMLLAGFGWAKPVPINTRNFKNPRRDMALSSAAGPVSNLLLAIIFAGLYKAFLLVVSNVAIGSERTFVILSCISAFFYYGISLNVTLAVFNLLPVPPFDGSRILYVFLPPKLYFGIMKYEQYIYIGMMLLLVLGFLSPIISAVTGWIMKLIFLIFAI